MLNYDVVIVGGGAAGLSAAIEAKKQGLEKIIILEKEKFLGGILNHCIHSGFGRYILNEQVTGPEYANIFVEEIKKLGIEYKLETMVLKINKDKNILAVNGNEGIIKIKAKAIILAMGCREKTKAAANISGSTFAGVFTAGMTQRLINLEGIMPGKEVVILGSGDLGLVIAKRLTIEGAKVKAVVEILPYCNGLEENYNKCLKPFNIPLRLQYTIIDIVGKERVQGVTIAKVDKDKKIIEGTEEFIACDTVILSVGLIPESELFKEIGLKTNNITGGAQIDESMQTSVQGIFACGNVVHIHDYVDYVTEEGILAGKQASKYILNKLNNTRKIKIINGKGVSYILPSTIHIDNIENSFQFKFRSDKKYKNVKIKILYGKENLEFSKRKIIPSKMGIINIDKEDLKINSNIKEIIIEICEL